MPDEDWLRRSTLHYMDLLLFIGLRSGFVFNSPNSYFCGKC